MQTRLPLSSFPGREGIRHQGRRVFPSISPLRVGNRGSNRIPGCNRIPGGCKTRSFMHVTDHLGVAARAGPPHTGELPEARRRRREGAAGAGRGWGVASASALGRGPVGGAVGLEFPSKGIRIPFEGNSKGTGSVLEVLCVVSGTSCNHHLGLPRIGCAFPSTVHFEGIRRGMDGDWDYDDRWCKPLVYTLNCAGSSATTRGASLVYTLHVEDCTGYI